MECFVNVNLCQNAESNNPSWNICLKVSIEFIKSCGVWFQKPKIIYEWINIPASLKAQQAEIMCSISVPLLIVDKPEPVAISIPAETAVSLP